MSKITIENNARSILFTFYIETGLYDWLNIQERMLFCHVGLCGHVSMLDNHYAKNNGLKPLTHIELWMMKPIISMEKAIRQTSFSEATFEILGEY